MTRRDDLARQLSQLPLQYLQEDGLACVDCGAPFYGTDAVPAVPVGGHNAHRCAPGHGCHKEDEL